MYYNKNVEITEYKRKESLSHGIIDDIKARAKTSKKTIVLPETEDIRTYEAAEAVLKEGTANLILVGSEEEIAKNKGSLISAEQQS